MRFISLTLLCVLTAFFSYAQTGKVHQSFGERSWFSMNGALGFPLQNYADADIHNPEAGFAKVGYLGKLDIGIKVYKSFGLCLSGIGGVNKVDEHPFEMIMPDIPGITKEVNTTPWKYIGGMGGIYMTTLVGRGALMLKGQLGYVSVTSFSLDMLLSSGKDFERLAQGSAKTGAVIVDFGLIGIIPLNEIAFLNIGIDYINCSPEFKNVSFEHTSSFGPPEYDRFDFSMEMKQVAFSTGITWQF